MRWEKKFEKSPHGLGFAKIYGEGGRKFTGGAKKLRGWGFVYFSLSMRDYQKLIHVMNLGVKNLYVQKKSENSLKFRNVCEVSNRYAKKIYGEKINDPPNEEKINDDTVIVECR